MQPMETGTGVEKWFVSGVNAFLVNYVLENVPIHFTLQILILINHRNNVYSVVF